MKASKPIRRMWVSILVITISIFIGIIASNATAAQVTLAWDPNTESDLAGYKIHYGTASNSYSVHIDVHNVTTYTVTGLTDGQTYYLAATAYDASGNESGYSNSVTYGVPGANGAPTTPATPSGATSAPVNTAVTFSTSATDPNGDSLQYQYDWGGGVLSGWGAASQSHSWTAAGQYAVKVQAQDSKYAVSAWSAAKTVTITQNTQNAAPTTPASPTGASNALVNTAITFSTSASDPNGDRLEYRYDWSGGVVSGWGAASQSHSWTAAGQYAVKAQARDSQGAESAWSSAKTISITQNTQNAAPTTPAIPSGASSAMVNTAITFNTSASDPNGDSLEYRYDWGGGVFSNWGAAGQSRSWAAAGQYAVKAQARDSLKAESAWSAAKTVTISQNSTPGVADSDGDGVPDSQDAFPNNPKEWADANRNGIGDNTDAAAAANQTNQAPNAPTLASPIDDAKVNSMAVLKTGPFRSPVAGTTHAKTRWQVFGDEDNVCVFDILSSTALTSLPVPKLVLDEGTAYFWRAQVVDSKGAASAWSDYEYFSTVTSGTDRNANGIPDAQEVSWTTDLDRDGVRDIRQRTIKSVKMVGTSAQFGVSIKDCPTALAIEAVESEGSPPSGSYSSETPGRFPFGLINCRVAVAKPGDQATVKIYFSQAVPRESRWYEYDTASRKWYDFSPYVKFATDRRSATLSLTDGGIGDADGVANGVIVDPGGIFVP